MACNQCGGPKILLSKERVCEVCGKHDAEYCNSCFDKNRDEGFDSRNDEVQELVNKIDELKDKLSKIYDLGDKIDDLADKITDEAQT